MQRKVLLDRDVALLKMFTFSLPRVVSGTAWSYSIIDGLHVHDHTFVQKRKHVYRGIAIPPTAFLCAFIQDLQDVFWSYTPLD